VGSQPLIAHAVVLALCFRIMLATVQFDDHAFFEADEIDNVFSQRKLTAEFQAFKGAAPKPSPETCLRFGWKAPKLSRAIPIASQTLASGPAPSPLSREGRGEQELLALPRGERGTGILTLPAGGTRVIGIAQSSEIPRQDETTFTDRPRFVGRFPLSAETSGPCLPRF
jgi:hypothetical protein